MVADDRSEREKHLEELYEAMKERCQELEKKIAELESEGQYTVPSLNIPDSIL